MAWVATAVERRSGSVSGIQSEVSSTRATRSSRDDTQRVAETASGKTTRPMTPTITDGGSDVYEKYEAEKLARKETELEIFALEVHVCVYKTT